MKKPHFTFEGKSANVLSSTKSMSCASFSLLAGKGGSCTFSTENVKGTICNSCYAMTGNYIYTSVIKTQSLRTAWTKAAMEGDPSEWIATLIKEIRATKDKYFRWHDSGDIFSEEYASAIYEVCKALPKIKFWIPTRANDVFTQCEPMLKLAALKNVVIRKSAIRVNEPANSDTLTHFSMVAKSKEDVKKGYIICPKSTNHSSCGQEECRKCWSRSTKKVAYIYHGHAVTEKIFNRRKTLTVID